MYISALKSCDYSNSNNNKNKNPSFKMLVTDYSANRLIKQLPHEDRVEIKNIRKRLSKTKFWDLHVSATEGYKNFIFRFVNKYHPERVIKNDINPYKIEGNEISIYTINSGNRSELSYVDVLTYNTKKEAEKLYERHKVLMDEAVKKHWILSPLENLLDRENKLNMLDRALVLANKVKTIDTLAKTKEIIGI